MSDAVTVAEGDLVAALRKVKTSNPEMGWKKVAKTVNEINGWNVDLSRIKSALKANNLMVAVPPAKVKDAAPVRPVAAAMAAAVAKAAAAGAGGPAAAPKPKSSVRGVDAHAPPTKKRRVGAADAAAHVSSINPHIQTVSDNIDPGELKEAIKHVIRDNPSYGYKSVCQVLSDRWPKLKLVKVRKAMQNVRAAEEELKNSTDAYGNFIPAALRFQPGPRTE